MQRRTMTPQELFDAANTILTVAQDYKEDYTKLISEVNDLCTNGSYVGEDATLFNQKIQEFQKNYDAMHKLMQDYAEYLKNVAQNMIDIINENISKISSIE